MSGRVPLRDCQVRLLILWAGLGGLALVVLLIQVAPGGVYAGRSSDLLDWFLPTVMPTISLMVGTLVAEKRAEPSPTVDRFAYRLALWLSVLYLLIVIVALLAFADSRTPLDDLRGSAKLITAIYGLVGLALGVLFVTQKSEG
jgi:hypothetical protein